MPDDSLLLHVRDGEVVDQGAWIYAWLHDGRVVHLGATALHPATRSWLHLNDPNPDVGRIGMRYPNAKNVAFDVVALLLPPDVSRPEARQAAIAEAVSRNLLSDAYVGFDPTDDDFSPAALEQGRKLCDLIAARVTQA